MRFVVAFVRWLWEFSKNSWVTVDENLRPRSRASALYLFLFIVFFIIGGILMLLGFDLADVDRWIDAQGGWLDAIGSLLFRLVCGVALLAGAGLALGGLYQQMFARSARAEDRIGWGVIVVGAIIAYFAWFGVVG